MAETTDVGMDAVEELRLRRWARQHHVAPSERDNTWHPIVLDEMRRRDHEGDPESDVERRIHTGALVPLAPHQLSPMTPRIASTPDERLLFRIDAVNELCSGAD